MREVHSYGHLSPIEFGTLILGISCLLLVTWVITKDFEEPIIEE